MQRPSLVKQRTFAIDKDEVDFRVLEFHCLDNSVLTSLGQHSKQTHWRVQVGSRVVDIQLRVDRSVVGWCEVGVICDGQQVFPHKDEEATPGQQAKPAKSMKSLKETFTWRCPFRGTVKGLGKPRHFEIRPKHAAGDVWYPATLREQLPDGTFRAMAYLPDGGGKEKEVFYPLVEKSNLRDATTKRPVGIPERSLVLHIPAQDPLHATLAVDNEELITHFFARPTPAPAKFAGNPEGSRITLCVKQDRSLVTSDRSFAIFQHFLVGDVRAVRQDASKLRHAWVIQVGPFAEHTIEIAKHPKSSKVYILTVDGEVLVESCAEDIESREDWWECQFRLLGEKYLDWEVFETDVDGNMLETKGTVSQRTKYTHEVVVSFAATAGNLGMAKLHVDGVDFQQLAEYRNPGRGGPLSCSPEALHGTYNLMTPYKVNESAPGSFAALSEALGGLFCSPGDFWLRCCGRPSVLADEGGSRPVRPGRPMSRSPKELGPDDAILRPEGRF